MSLEQARWQRVCAIFESALEHPLSRRNDFVADACRDDSTLEADVAHMLSAHSHAGSFLQSAIVQTALRAGDTSAPERDQPDAAGLTGRILSHYRLQEPLGAGGMGVVYRAQDLALGRAVAIKILPQSFSSAVRGILIRESEACARLQHPAVATFFESGEIDSRAFIAMELVGGETLLARLRTGPLPVDEAVAIAHCVLDALVHAHSAGILHCDIKPANIMLTGPRAAKLLDFGLAKHLLASGPDAATREATAQAVIAGTIGYMSPEQILSEPLDVRSDVFQVGVVLYEMLTGQPAFPGASAVARLAAVLSKKPPRIEAPGVPPGLAAMVERAMSRTPDARYPNAASMLRELIAVSSGDWTHALPDTLAILDFDNLSADGRDDWIGSGIADSLGADLGRSSGLTVVPRDAVLRSRARLQAGTPESRAVELGLGLGCRWVLTGDYERMGDALRLTVRMVDVAPASVAARKELSAPMAELFAIHDRIAEFATASLSLTSVTPRTRPALSAYECYSRGQRLFKRLEKGSIDQALELFERAIELDAHCAAALSGAAGIHAMRFTYTTDPSTLARAISYAQRAIEADPGSGEAHVWLGYALWRLDRVADANAAWRRARELDASLFWGFYFGTAPAHLLGHSDDALELARRSIELEPKAAYTWYALGSLHLDLGNLSEALWSYENAGRVNALPDASPFPGVGGYIAECHRRAGRLDEARALCLESLRVIEGSDHMYRDSFRVFSLVVLGDVALDQSDPEAARAAFDQAIAHVKGRPRTLAGGWLVVRALAGLALCDRDAAPYREACSRFATRTEFDFSWLWQCEEAAARRDLHRAAEALGEPTSEPVRGPAGV